MNTAIPILIRRIGEKLIARLHLHKKEGGAFTPPPKLNPEFMAQVTNIFICFAAVHEDPVNNNNVKIQDTVQKQQTQR